MAHDLALPMSRRFVSSCGISTALVSLVGLCCAGRVWAEEQPETIPPPADFARLDSLAGSWEGNLVYSSRATPGKAKPKVTATVTWILNRYHLKIELCRNPKNVCPDVLMIISYDVQKKKYLLYVLYNSAPVAELYEGKFLNAKTLVFKRTWKNGEMLSHSRLRLTAESASTWKMLKESDTVPGDYETDLAPEAQYQFDSKTTK
jgi:hypothetical protein